MSRVSFSWVAGLALASFTLLATGAEPPLRVGTKAPVLQPGRWIQGDPVKECSSDKAYLVNKEGTLPDAE